MRLSRLHVAVLATLPAVFLVGCPGETKKSFPFPATPVQAAGSSSSSGDNQTGIAGQALALPFVVQVVDTLGGPVEGVAVDWAMVSGGGTVTVPHTVSDKKGLAQTSVILGPKAGANVFAATVDGNGGVRTITFQATGTAGPPAVVTILSGDGQTGSTGSTLPGALVVTVSDAIGNPCTSSVTFTSSNGSSVNPSVTQTNNQGQAQTFLTLGSATGDVFVRATIVVNGGQLVTAVFHENAVPAGAFRTVFLSNPTSTTAGTTLSSFQVGLVDQFGNIVTTATNPITVGMGNNPTGSALNGTLTVAPTNGVATFSTLSINGAGANYTLVATSTGPAASASAPFDIVAAGPNQVAFAVQPTNATAGQPFATAVQVRVLDAFGNIANTAQPITISLGNNTSGATLSGTTMANAVAGTAVFNNLSVDRVQGTQYVLTATSPGVIAATSNGFSIVAATAAKLVVTGQPAAAQT
ncbi:MAG: hypothetical protein ACAI25_16945, partial [Planctomycetota bacterium]